MKFALGIGVGAIVVGALLIALPPQAQESDEPEQHEVSDAEVEGYIEVYSAMQADHDLAIEAALAPHNMPLERFRDIERRIQREQRLVDRVRQALLDQAKNRAASALAPGKNAAPDATPTPKRAGGR